eukprot:gene5464-638_t
MDHQGLRLVNGDKTELILVAFSQFLKVVQITTLKMQLLVSETSNMPPHSCI